MSDIVQASGPPANVRIEAALIGAILNAPGAATSFLANTDLGPEDFYRQFHRHAWAAITEIVAQGHEPDPLVVRARLTGQDSIDQQQLDDRLEEIAAEPAAVGNFRAFAIELKRLALRRAWLDAGYHMMAAAHEDDETMVAQAEQILAKPTVSEDTSSPEQLGSDAFDWMSDTGTSVAIATGYPTIDRMVGQGLRPGDMTAIGGWTNMGKSPLCDGMLLRAARAGRRVHLYVNEMSKLDRTLRFVAMDTGLSMTRMQSRELTEHETPRFSQAVSRLQVGITDISTWGAGQIARHIRANKWDLCAIDVLHNMAYEGEAELSAITQTLAAAARSSGTHLILVCHLNEKRAESAILPRPVIRDIRSSGMIKNLCSNVVLLHRPQEKDRVTDEITTSLDGVLHWDKARHGQPCAAPVTFAAKWMSFLPAGDREPMPAPGAASAPSAPAAWFADWEKEHEAA